MVLELGAMRVWLHFGLDLKLGLPGFVDYDLLFPVPLGLFVLLHLLNQERPLDLRFSIRALGINGIFLFGLAAWSWMGKTVGSDPGFFYRCQFWLLVLATGISAANVWFPLVQLKQYQRLWVAFPCFLGSSAIVFVKNFYGQSWPLYSRLSASVTCSTLAALSSTTRCSWYEDGYMFIFFRDVSTFMGPPCSGVDCLIIFAIAFCVFSILNRMQLNPMRCLFVFLSGALFSFALNQLRMLAIYLGSASIGAYFESAAVANQVMIQLFHTHAGWLLYFTGLGTFFWIWKRHGLLAPAVTGAPEYSVASGSTASA